jgi:membrane protein implicated in regulation of membrane protease activity
MAQPRPVARTRVLSIGFLTAFFGLTLLLALAVVARWDNPWRYVLVLIPLVFAALVGVEVRRSVKSPDELTR